MLFFPWTHLTTDASRSWHVWVKLKTLPTYCILWLVHFLGKQKRVIFVRRQYSWAFGWLLARISPFSAETLSRSCPGGGHAARYFSRSDNAARLFHHRTVEFRYFLDFFVASILLWQTFSAIEVILFCNNYQQLSTHVQNVICWLRNKMNLIVGFVQWCLLWRRTQHCILEFALQIIFHPTCRVHCTLYWRSNFLSRKPFKGIRKFSWYAILLSIPAENPLESHRNWLDFRTALSL